MIGLEGDRAQTVFVSSLIRMNMRTISLRLILNISFL